VKENKEAALIKAQTEAKEEQKEQKGSKD